MIHSLLEYSQTIRKRFMNEIKIDWGRGRKYYWIDDKGKEYSTDVIFLLIRVVNAIIRRLNEKED